jgi:hypothetical protein
MVILVLLHVSAFVLQLTDLMPIHLLHTIQLVFHSAVLVDNGLILLRNCL